MITVNDINNYVGTSKDCKLSKGSWKVYKSNLNTLKTPEFKYAPDTDLTVFLLNPEELCKQMHVNKIEFQKASDILKALKFCYDYATIITNKLQVEPELTSKWALYNSNFLHPLYGEPEEKPRKPRQSKQKEETQVNVVVNSEPEDNNTDDLEEPEHDVASVTSMESDRVIPTNVVKNEPEKAQTKRLYTYIKDLEQKVYALNERTLFLQDIVFDLIKAMPQGIPNELAVKLCKLASQQFQI